MSKPDTLRALPDLLALRNTLRRAGISLHFQDEAKDDLGKLVLMVDLFCASIETGVFPTHASPMHRMARKLVETSGMKPRRRRRKFSDKTQPGYPIAAANHQPVLDEIENLARGYDQFCRTTRNCPEAVVRAEGYAKGLRMAADVIRNTTKPQAPNE